MKKVYVTGAGGFVGRNLIEKLRKVNTYEVKPVVRNKVFYDSVECVIDLSIATESELFDTFKDAHCIIHLAALANFQSEFDFNVYNFNCLATIRLINAVQNLNIHFIFASNALISGISTNYIDSSTIDRPEIPYNIAKYISEQYLKERIERVTILRIGGIFGFEGPSHLYLNRAISEIKQNGKLPNIIDNGLGKRNYLYVEDLCGWISEIIDSCTYGKVLMGGFETLTIKEIFEQLCEVFIHETVELSVDNDIAGVDQIISCDFPKSKMHTYKEAFKQIRELSKV